VKKFINIQIFTGAIMLLACLRVNAIPTSITGDLGMIGSFIAVDNDWISTGAAAATGVDFDQDRFGVVNATGSFASLAGIGSITDFQFDPQLGINNGSDGITPVTSIADFWTIGGFSFELTSVSRGYTDDPATYLVLQGTGIIRDASGDHLDTLGTWEFTGDTTMPPQEGGTFSWSAGSASVPEPGMLALLGIGLIGFAGRNKRKITEAGTRIFKHKLEDERSRL